MINKTSLLEVGKLQLPKGSGEVNHLLGTWLNTSPCANSLEKVIISAAKGGELQLQGFARVAGDLVDWGIAPIQSHVASLGQVGFLAAYQSGQINCHLVANYKLGVLVILRMTHQPGSNGREGFVVREFFHQQDPVLVTALKPAPLNDPNPVDLSPFAGAWVNCNALPGWLTRFCLFREGDDWRLRAESHGHSLPVVAVTSYMDNMQYLAFKAHYQLDHARIFLAANTQKELVVVTVYQRYQDDPAKDKVEREVFFRQQGGL